MSNFDFVDRPIAARKYGKSGNGPVVIAGGAIVIGVLAAGAWWFFGTPPKLSLANVENQTVRELDSMNITVHATAEGLGDDEWYYKIASGPPGMKIDLKSGLLTWTPEEEQGPGEYSVTVSAQAKGGGQAHDKRSFKVVVQEVNQPPSITKIPVQTVASGDELRVPIEAKDVDRPAQKLSYLLKQGPPGAKLDASGVLTWSVPETSTEQNHVVEIIVADAPSDGAESVAAFKIHVTPPASPSLRFVAALKEAGLSVEKTSGTAVVGFHGRHTYFKVENEPLTMIEYDSEDIAKDEISQITDDGKMAFGESANWPTRTAIFQKGLLIALFGGGSQQVQQTLSQQLGEPYAVAEAGRMKPRTDKAVEPTILEGLVNSLAKLHEKKDLLGRTDYPGVRKLFAEFFEKQNEATLNILAAGDGAEFKKWLDAHAEFKEEFFIAVAPEDDFAAAYKILQTLHQKFRKAFDDYGLLAIATALTWDNEGNVYQYDSHQRRTHSAMPGGLLKAVENFEYFVDLAEVMQGRAQYLPWEFQMHMINHKTPRAEREWAVENFADKRVMFGKCYSDVPYDQEMLKTDSRVCRLAGMDYSLPNILQFGGVCAMQADFASRVGKCIGVPATYVSGESAGGDAHAWVMWVELKQVSRTGISFTLESHGRYRGDKFYVGTLRDPQTGQKITDRELELRLQAVGLSPAAYHHAKLVMQAYPQLRDKLALKPAQEIVFLNTVIDLCPGSEAAWQQVAALAREGKIGTDSFRLMNGMLDKLFHTFANFPDFTWTVFDDLVQYQKNPKQRYQFYERLVQMYEAAERPDLSCEARLKLSDYLLKEGRSTEVIEGLAFTIKKFPDEGRYVPRLLDKLEKVCEGVKGSDEVLLQFYLEFIPQIPQTRGKEPSPYCMRMLERAIAKFKAAGQAEQALAFADQLAKLKAMRNLSE